MTIALVLLAVLACVEVGTMQRFCRCAGRGAGRVGRAIVGWFFLVLAVMATQVAGVWPVVAQAGLASSGAGSSTVLAWG